MPARPSSRKPKGAAKPRTRRPQRAAASGPAAPTVAAALVALREELAALRRDLARPAPVEVDGLREALAAAIERMARARAAIVDGLDTLPRDPAYARATAHLRELATVSPSIAQLFSEVSRISLPLGEAITSLRRAAEELAQEERRARNALGAAGR